MTFFTKFILVSFLALPLLAGCESFQKETRSVETSPVTIAPRAPLSVPPSDSDLRMMNTKLSGGSVEVFSLDGPAPDMGVPIPAVVRDQDYGATPMTNDPRVTVYPLDGVSASASYIPERTSSMTPAPYAAGSEPAWPVGSAGHDVVTREKLPSKAGGAVSSIYFPYGSSDLGGGDKSVLREAAETAKFAPVERIVVEGYASQPTQTNDPVKAKILNLKESLKRATVVSERLIESGVPAEKIKTVGWGDTKPAGGSEAAQRRVDIVTGGAGQ